jgi:hypothetical protein
LLKEVNRRSEKQKQLDRQIKDNQKELSQKYAKLGGVKLDDDTDNDADNDGETESDVQPYRRNSRKSSDRNSSKDKPKVRRLSELDAESIKSSKTDRSASRDKSKDRKSRDRSEDSRRSSLKKSKSKDKAEDKEAVKQKLLDDIIKLKEAEKTKQKEIEEQIKQLSKSGGKKSKEAEKGIGLFLESTDSLYDNSGNLLSENNTIKYIGKASGKLDSIEKPAKNKSLFKPNDYETDTESVASKKSNLKDTEKTAVIDERELMEILHAVEVQEAEQKGKPAKPASHSSSLCNEKTKYFYNGKEVYIDSNILANKKAIVIVNDEIKDISERDARIKKESGMDDFYHISVVDKKRPRSIRFSDELNEINLREVKEELAKLNKSPPSEKSSGYSSSGSNSKRDEPKRSQHKSERRHESRNYANVIVANERIEFVSLILLLFVFILVLCLINILLHKIYRSTMPKTSSLTNRSTRRSASMSQKFRPAPRK